MNLILIGMPAVGKSTIGVILAKSLGFDFIDTDLIIQNKYGATLEKLISENGMDGFLHMEEDAILGGSWPDRTVIATGGSVVYSAPAMQYLKMNGKVIYLFTNVDVIEERIRNVKTRGVAIREGQTLTELYEERSLLYEKYADVMINTENKLPEDIVTAICEHYHRHDNA